MEVEIRPLDDYVDRIVRIQQTRAILPTASLVLKTASTMPPPWCHEAAHKICRLISLAAGTVVEWIRADGFDPEVNKHYRFHSAGAAKPFCSLPTVPIKELSYEANTNVLKAFLQSGLNRFSLGDDRRLQSLIAAFLDARLEGEFLETRGIKVAVTLEILKDSFVAKLISDEWEPRMPATLRKRIARLTKAALSADGIDTDTITIVTETLGQPSRPSLRRIINYILKVLKLSEEKTVVDAVITIRNRLVHTGQFVSHNDPETAAKLKIVDAAHEFYLLLSFVDRVLLRTFGHSGGYIDYSKSNRASTQMTISFWRN
jgi:hypothetical protein